MNSSFITSRPEWCALEMSSLYVIGICVSGLLPAMASNLALIMKLFTDSPLQRQELQLVTCIVNHSVYSLLICLFDLIL